MILELGTVQMDVNEALHAINCAASPFATRPRLASLAPLFTRQQHGSGYIVSPTRNQYIKNIKNRGKRLHPSRQRGSQSHHE